MNNDKAIVFKSQAHKIENMLNNINKLGIDNSSYYKKFKDIVSNVQSNAYVSNDKYNGYQGMFLVQDYTKGISELQKLEFELNKFDIYFKAFSFSKLVMSRLKSDISDNELKELVNKSILLLQGIRNSDTLYYEEEKVIIEGIYESLYNLMKLEFFTFGSSQIFSFLSVNNEDIYFIDKSIRRDLERIELNDIKYTKLREKKLYLDTNGVNTTYFDMEMIMLIVYLDNNVSLKKRIIDNLNLLINEINDNVWHIGNKNCECHNVLDRYLLKKKNVDELKVRLVSALLSLSLYIGGAVVIYNNGKSFSTGNHYKTITESYSMYGSDTKENLISTENTQDKVYLKVYSVWEHYVNQYIREVKTYDVSHINLEKNEDYLLLNIDDLGIDPHINTEIVHDSDETIILYKEPYVEAQKVIVNQDEVISKVNIDSMVFGLFIAYILYITLLIVIETSPFSTTYFGLINNIHIINDKNLFSGLKNKHKLNSELKVLVKELLDYINKDKELRNRFNLLYEKNKFLLDNEEELFNKLENFDNLDIERIKKLKI